MNCHECVEVLSEAVILTPRAKEKFHESWEQMLREPQRAEVVPLVEQERDVTVMSQ